MRKRLALIISLPLIVVCSAGLVGFIGAQENPGGSAFSKVAASLAGDVPPDPAGGGLSAAASPLPAEIRYYPDRIYRGNRFAMYRVSRSEGVLASMDEGETWTARNAGLPVRAVYPFSRDLPPLVTSFAVDAMNELHIALTLPESAFVSGDGGKTWAKLGVGEPLKPNDQLTAIDLDPTDMDSIVIGTSFHGFFETKNRGKTWTELSDKLSFMSFGGGTSEEVASLAYVPSDPSLIVLCLGFGNGIYLVQKEAGTAVAMEFPGDQGIAPIVDLRFRGTGAPRGWKLEARTDNARWSFPLDPSESWTSGKGLFPAGNWSLDELIGVQPPMDEVRLMRQAKAADKYGIYVSSYHASEEIRLDRHIAFCKANGLNSIVIDFKDEFGIVAYDTALEAPKKIGAAQKRFETAKLVKKVHDAGLYLIARIVVFRDKQLYNSDGYAYAVWDRLSNGPWRYMKKTADPETGEESLYQGEHWVDPYSERVWQYNAEIARELEGRGVDEIQFDYIRFPSDGDLSRVTYRFKKTGMGKVEALESFLAMAREKVSIPIGTDVYGYCGWSRISGWVAQNIEEFSRYVDVISPMYYPSHFPSPFLGRTPYMARAGRIYLEGGNRAARIVAGRSLIRPYVQAFRLGAELKLTAAESTNYLMSQIQGALQGASSGFMLWNASNDYYMVTKPLGAYIPPRVSEPGGTAADTSQGG